ncbi:MAG: MBL fold metallo-hydrolase [Clostridia bacterium]|nr:MBL fold metallo-hydrolase [Clostridia bacterium]
MKITALSENTSRCGLETEHGLSLYIETKGQKILFDTGQGGLFAKNAKKLGIDISDVDLAVISHGHYDHGGGLSVFLEINEKAKVYMSRLAFEPYYSGERYIGLDAKLKGSERITFTDGRFTLSPSCELYGCGDKDNTCGVSSSGLSVMREGRLVSDDFLHEQYLLIREDEKTVLISGCSHRGIINIARRFLPDVLVGGFHFSKLLLDGTLKAYAEALDSTDTAYYTCHCTGKEQYDFMKKHMRRLNYISAGDTLIL